MPSAEPITLPSSPLQPAVQSVREHAVSRPHGSGAPIAILGVPFDNVTTAEAIARIEQMIASGQPHYLATANVDFLVQAHADIELRRILFDAHLVLCDGTPLLWASRLLGNPLPERVAGSDLVPLLLRLAEQRGYRIFFLGAAPESANQALANLRRDCPDLVVAGHYSPPYRRLLEMDHDEIRRRILDARPDLLFVCFGCPKQEKWIAMHYRTLGVPVSVGVGGTMDFLAGHLKRAPKWMQRTGTEWIFRLAQEPQRLLRRYSHDLWVFGRAILAQWWQLQFRSGHRVASAAEAETAPGASCHLAPLPERLDCAAVQANPRWVEQFLAAGRHCLLDAASVAAIDSTGVGFLIRVRKQLHAAGRQMVLIAPSAALRRALALMRLQDFFDSAPDYASAEGLIAAHGGEQLAAVLSGEAKSGHPVVWRGEITAVNAEEVWQETCLALASAAPSQTLSIDLSGVRFIDSSGLGIMVRARKLANSRAAELSFTGLRPAVRNVVRLARLEEFLLGVI